jgi:hypothetical protein
MKGTTPKARELAYNKRVTSINLKALRVAEEEKLPPSEDDDDKKENPFEEFINQNLPLDSVPKDGTRPPADDVSDRDGKKSPDGFFDDLDDDDDDEKPVTRSPFSSGSGSPFPPFRPPSSSPFGKPPTPGSGSRFGGGSGSSDDKPDKPSSSPFGSSRFGSSSSSPFGASGSGSGSRFGSGSAPLSGSGGDKRPSLPPRSTPPSSTGRLFGTSNPNRKSWFDVLKETDHLNTFYAVVGVIVLLLAVLSLMYVDRLRMTIALKDGQITELRYQVESLEARLRDLAPPTPPVTGE